MVDLSLYKVCLVTSVTEKADRANSKPLKICQVDVGDGTDITVVTIASNVREKSRLVVAPAGSKVLDEETNEQEFAITETTVGGVKSQGMFCDTRMLGWSGSAAAGIAAQIPESHVLGSVPPAEKPGLVSFQQQQPAVAAVDVQPLFERKLTKEEKKKLAEEKKLARKAAKAAKKEAETN